MIMDVDITSSTSLENDMPKEDQTSGAFSESNSSKQLNMPTKSSYQKSAADFRYRQNQVNNVMLHGVPIVSLYIDGKERLCLAQISNTLLKNFSYNEIHNRRVALGITCVQCTPVQLEILRRAGAMPISSRRCGMISHREAERLVKSFLEDNSPPKLPEDFYFEVFHKCGWGGQGKFQPSRYNSSRAKCIKCTICNLFFSPNKFIFHFHRTADSTYNHPDAANFNSWRRHLHLLPGKDSDDVMHAWEDVKAMFNGGNRKRMTGSFSSSSSPSSSHTGSETKKLKLQEDGAIFPKPNYNNIYPGYPLLSVPGKSYPFTPLAAPNPLGISFPTGKDNMMETPKGSSIGSGPWRPQNDFMIPSYDLLWTNQWNMRARAGVYRPGMFGATMYQDLLTKDQNPQSPDDSANSSEEEDRQSPHENSTTLHNNYKSREQRLSAFRPVYKSGMTSQNMANSDHDADEDSDVDVEEDEVVENNNDEIEKETENGPETEADGRTYSPDTSNQNDARHEDQPNILEEELEKTEEKDTTHKEDEEESSASEEKGTFSDHENVDPCESKGNDNSLSKEELQEKLDREIEIRRKIEDDVNKMKETFDGQVTQEKTYRDALVQQLQVVKEALCNELEQERKMRFSMQQKLKEAHDALHNFSCKMLASRQCAECAFKEANNIPR